MNFYRRFGKRLFDVLAASVLAIVTLPVQLVLASLVGLKLGKPVIFAQERPGKDARPFLLRKFRTMTDERGPDGVLLPDHARLTLFGTMLRSTSLDELPEIYNVLRGDMSLVGPRPLLMQYLPRYSPEQSRRHEIRPGITGWAQINGRNETTWDEKFAQDVWYVDNISFILDVKILLRTLRSVVIRDGINAEGHATAPEFLGNRAKSSDHLRLGGRERGV